MKHERFYYTCDGCGNELSEEGHTVVTADYTGYRDPTENDGKTWDLCAGCWLKIFHVLDEDDRKRRGMKTLERLREESVVSPGSSRANWLDDDDLRPWDDI